MNDLFLMPDYYPRFQCKGGACRRSCCEGWPVTISMQDYFRLLGLSCTPELRRRLDAALHLLSSPSPERYAELACNWEGICPLQQPDGLCALHAECGGETLSVTCRYHPRSIRTAFDAQCCCSASCEATVELLLAQREPLRLVRNSAHFDLPCGPVLAPEAAQEAREARDAAVELLQDRSRPLSARLFAFVCEGSLPAPSLAGDETAALSQLRALSSALLGEGASQDYCAAACQTVADDPACLRRAAEQLRRLLPEADILFEHLVVNHLLFMGYPFDAEGMDRHMQRLAICAAHLAVSFTLTGFAPQAGSCDALVDACAACFRVIEHSNFDRRASRMLRALPDASLGAMLRVL